MSQEATTRDDSGRMSIWQRIGGAGTKRLVQLAILAVGVIFFATVPLWLDVDKAYFGYYMFVVFIYVTVAQGWNLLAGYTGQISLSQNAFFGLGAYTMALIWLNNVTKTWYFFDPVVMILAGIVPAIVAIIIGLPLMSRLRGDYFSFGTLGFGMIINTLFIKGGTFTGGANGVSLDATRFSSLVIYYYVAFALAVLATVVVYLLTNFKIGLALKAIREDEVSAASHGIPVLRYKIFAFAVGAFMAGMAGSVYGYYLFHVEPDSVFNSNWLFYPILICVLGGTGTIMGPVIGAFAIAWMFSYGSVYFGGFHPIASGVLIILVMKFMPGGIMGLPGQTSGWFRGHGGAPTAGGVSGVGAGGPGGNGAASSGL
jgi:branched-chain amino acid transport system permease protein